MSEHTNSTAVEVTEQGFNRQEPRYGLVAVFGLGSVVIIAVLILGLVFLYDRYHEQQVYVKQQVPIWQDLKGLHAREDGELHSYGYVDKTKGVVRLPIDRAMDLLAKEAAANKLPYDTANKPVPPPQPVGAAPGTPPAAAAPAGAVNAAHK